MSRSEEPLTESRARMHPEFDRHDKKKHIPTLQGANRAAPISAARHQSRRPRRFFSLNVTPSLRVCISKSNGGRAAEKARLSILLPIDALTSAVPTNTVDTPPTTIYHIRLSSAMTVPTPQTYTYKTFTNIGGEQTAIPVDVYIPESAGQTKLTPVVWVHTGGFLQGTRKFVPPHFLRALEKHNLALVAPDFRLCPQVSISQVLEDVTDCIRWTLDPEARSASGFKADFVSADNYILGGSSAGGWPALLLGLGLHKEAERIPQPPSAVFAIYAITTVTQDLASFFYEPQKPLSWAVDGKLIEEEPLEREGHLQKCLDAHHRLLEASSIQIRTEAPPASNPVRAALYNFARQEGTYPSFILQDASESSQVCTPTLIKAKAKGATIPVLIAYGDSDPKVPHSQSLHVVDALKSVGYDDTSLLVIEEQGADHLFDMEPGKEIDGMWSWLAKQL